MNKRKTVVVLLLVTLILAACSSTGETTTNTLTLDYPDADPVRVALEIREGELAVRPGGSAGLSATVTTNVSQWQASAEATGDTVRITQGTTGRTEVINNAVNRWEVALGDDAPLALAISSEAANTNLNLGGLPVTSLEVNGRSGNLNLNYDTPIAGDTGGTLSASLQSGNVTASRLLNSRVRSINVTTVGGNTRLEFNGEALTQDMRARLEARTGNMVIRVPEGLPVRVTFDSTSGVLRQVSSGFTEVDNNAFETASYADASQPRVLIEVVTVTGTLQLEIVADL